MPKKKHSPNKTHRLTDREKKFLAARAKGLNMQESARAAGYSASSDQVLAAAATRATQQIERKAPDIFAEVGLDDRTFVKKCLVPALFAMERKVFNHNGKLVYSKPMIAWTPRTTTNQLVAKIKGMIKEEAAQAPGGVKVLIVNSAFRPPRPNGNGKPPENGAPPNDDTGGSQGSTNGN